MKASSPLIPGVHSHEASPVLHGYPLNLHSWSLKCQELRMRTAARPSDVCGCGVLGAATLLGETAPSPASAPRRPSPGSTAPPRSASGPATPRECVPDENRRVDVRPVHARRHSGSRARPLTSSPLPVDPRRGSRRCCLPGVPRTARRRTSANPTRWDRCAAGGLTYLA